MTRTWEKLTADTWNIGNSARVAVYVQQRLTICKLPHHEVWKICGVIGIVGCTAIAIIQIKSILKRRASFLPLTGHLQSSAIENGNFTIRLLRNS